MSRGFTLIELVLVVVVASIMAAAAVMYFSRSGVDYVRMERFVRDTRSALDKYLNDGRQIDTSLSLNSLNNYLTVPNFVNNPSLTFSQSAVSLGCSSSSNRSFNVVLRMGCGSECQELLNYLRANGWCGDIQSNAVRVGIW
ncbi:MAG: prepilin-type N-terminal cleavage/methylation domain-containing protein [Nitrososphaerota archaeon]